MGGLAYLFSQQLLGFYITDSAEAVAFGQLRMLWICAPYFICGLMDVVTGALRGLGKSLLPMMVSILGVCVLRIFWIYTVFQIPQYHTPDCLYASYIISWTVTFLCQFLLFQIAMHKLRKQAAE